MLDRELRQHTEALTAVENTPAPASTASTHWERVLEENVGLLSPPPAAAAAAAAAPSMLQQKDGHQQHQQAILGADVLTDLEVFEAYRGNDDAVAASDAVTHATVFSVVDRTVLHGGRVLLKDVLRRPICDLDALHLRQSVVRDLSHAYAERKEEADQALATLQRHEHDVLWFYEARDAGLQSLHDMVYFKTWLLRRLNGSDAALTAHNTFRMVVSPLVGILSPVLYFILPYVIIVYRFKLRIGFAAYMRILLQSLFKSAPTLLFSSGIRMVSIAFTMIFYFQGVFNNLELARAIHAISCTITERVDGFQRFAQAARSLSSILWDGRLHAAFFAEAFLPHDVTTPSSPTCAGAASGAHDAAHAVAHRWLPRRPIWTRHYGKHLRMYKMFDRQAHLPWLRGVYMLDAVLAIGRLVVQQDSCTRFAFMEWQPSIQLPVLRQVWHPCLDPQKAVRNDVHMRHMLLTGPNAGGKSTLLKSVMVAVLLSQTLTVANVAAGSCLQSPFALLHTQFQIPDCKGQASLFEAEMHRCKDNLDMLRRMQGRPAILALDEIFNSTNPVEGIAGAYAIAKKMASIPNTVCLISTHYVYLAKLSKDAGYALHRMNVKIEADAAADAAIRYPYRLTRGVSRQYIALELLRENGFDQDILDEAVAIKARLLLPQVPQVPQVHHDNNLKTS
jgi:hypothetical protein